VTSSLIFSDHWDEICTPRMGVAKLTRMAFEGQDMRALWHALMEQATDDVAGSGMGMDLSVISQLLGDQPTGLAIQNDTLAFQRLYRSPCAAARPRLRVLALAAVMDIGGNTPLEFLLENSDIALVTYYAVPGEPLPNPMPEHDVAIVVAPDGDAARPSMQAIAALAAHWPRPILNAPSAIAVLDRDRLYHRLNGIAGLEIPQTARIAIGRLHKLIADELPLRAVLEDGAFPLIIRPIGSHAGFGLEKIADRGALSSYLAERAETEFFISRFVDYVGADGMFRKYRIVMVDGKAYACHMAIAEEWKVWYLNADMALSAPNRMEEALFMQEFDRDFAARHAAALAEMAARIGLDYVAIDCAETRDGALLVFEADNTAIVHDMDPPNVYPYKPGQMQKIFKAVQAMLYRRAGRLCADAA
jgi:glutathione synthase/RimK-type ligase-like ATP-grasp enzyme